MLKFSLFLIVAGCKINNFIFLNCLCQLSQHCCSGISPWISRHVSFGAGTVSTVMTVHAEIAIFVQTLFNTLHDASQVLQHSHLVQKNITQHIRWSFLGSFFLQRRLTELVSIRIALVQLLGKKFSGTLQNQVQLKNKLFTYFSLIYMLYKILKH